MSKHSILDFYCEYSQAVILIKYFSVDIIFKSMNQIPLNVPVLAGREIAFLLVVSNQLKLIIRNLIDYSIILKIVLDICRLVCENGINLSSALNKKNWCKLFSKWLKKEVKRLRQEL